MVRPRHSGIVEEFGLLISFDLCTETDSHEALHAVQEDSLVSGLLINVERAIARAEQVFASSLMDHGNVTTIIDDSKAAT